MSLPEYDSSVYWKNYQIDTPTFALTSVEKPDMSPFLFHMTGRNEILAILSGKDGVSDRGFLQAFTPKYSGEQNIYDAKVVCLTESPTFALDFFRYRSFDRWQKNQLFGIGFDKGELAALGARPCVYADNQLKNDIILLKKHIEKNKIKDADVEERLVSLLNSIYPLTTPLLESEPSQGYMWEREWRYHNEVDEGLVFPYGAIRVICCPKSEEQELQYVLGEHSSEIKFVRSWAEYNEVTAYFRRRQKELNVPTEIVFDDEDDLLSALKEQLVKHEVTLNSIGGYVDFVESFGPKNDSAHETMHKLRANIEAMQREIDKIKERQKSKS